MKNIKEYILESSNNEFTKLNQERYNIFSVVYELVLLIK